MIDAPSSAARIVRFGPFELDLRSGELRKNGSCVSLQDQPLQILTALLERPGEMVTREELRKRLWPADTFVDFEHGLNAAVKRLRDALVDSADTPRFIETLPRRGYRFIAPVEGSGPAPPTAPTGARTTRRLQRYALGAALIVLLCVFLAMLAGRTAPPRVLRYTALNKHELLAFPPALSPIPLITDGSRIYFTEWLNGVLLPRQMPAAGGEAVAAFAAFDEHHVVEGISPDGAQLLVWAFRQGEPQPEARLWTVPVLGGAPRRLGDVMGHAATWSNGQIVYCTGEDIYITDSEGREPRKLVRAPGRAYWPRWSPDGSRLRFSSEDRKSGLSSLWEVTADGSGLRPFLPGWNSPSRECCGSWTSDGRYFVFQATRDSETHVWAMKERPRLFDGTPQPTRLTSGPVSFLRPVPSPDGRKLYVIGWSLRGELQKYDAVTGHLRPLLAGLSIEWLDFSKDGQWVSFISYPECELWRSRSDGSQRLKLTGAPIRAAIPRWSPDGSRIVFVGQMPGANWKLYMVQRDGGTVQPFFPGDRFEFDPTWSPDGESLAFGMQDGLHIVDLRSRRTSKVPGSDGLCSPRWSPDGRHLSAMPFDSSRQVLFDFGTRSWTDLAKVAGGYPSWSHDGQYLYFRSDWQPPSLPTPTVYRIRISDRKLERAFTFEDVRQAFGEFGFWIGLAPDDSPMLLRDLNHEDIYALDWEAP
jgi:Tol biopolymer transport system component/DNA-binding winged helix-turn-helix (wHTH) protein